MVRRSKSYFAWDQLPVVLTVEDAACVLRVNDQAVRRMIRDGKIPAKMVGKGYRIDRDALRRAVGADE